MTSQQGEVMRGSKPSFHRFSAEGKITLQDRGSKPSFHRFSAEGKITLQDMELMEHMLSDTSR